MESMFDSLDAQLEAATGGSGFPLDRVRFLCCMLLSFLFATIQHLFLTNVPAKVKHLYHISIGLFFMFWCFRYSTIILISTSFVVYVLVALANRTTCVKVGLPIVLLAMSGCHLYTMLTDWGSYNLDFTGPQMVITIKLFCFILQLYDGQYPDSKIMREQPYVRSVAVSGLPSLLEYFGWVFFYPSVLLISCEFRHYQEFCERRSIPTEGRTQAFIGTFATAIGCLIGGFGVGAAVFPLKYILSEAWVTETTFLYRWVFVLGCFTCVRAQYYFVWKLAECSFVLNGFAFYEDSKGNKHWDRMCNIKIRNFELAENYFEALNAWNEAAARWLKYYVYLRVETKNPFLPVLFTNLASAVWHGFYPGFYLAFLTAGLFRELATSLRRSLRYRFVTVDPVTKKETPKPNKFIYDRLCHILTFNALTYNFCVFTVFDVTGLNSSFRLLHSLYYAGHIIFVIAYASLKVFFPPPKRVKSQ